MSPHPLVREMLEFANFRECVLINDSMEDATMYEQAMMQSAS